MADIEKLVEEISGLTLIEASELVTALEDKLGVSASAPMPMMGAMPMMAGGAAEAEEEEEQTEFNVVLADFGPKKINVIKVVREVTSLGLKEAKEVVDSAPKAVKEAISKEEAETVKGKLEEVGATVAIK